MQPRLLSERPLIDLTDRIDREAAIYKGGGRFGDVFMCQYREPSGSLSLVAVKSLRFPVPPDNCWDATKKDLRRELGLWRRLDRNHQNIVPLLGIAKSFGPLDAIVSAWMSNGTLHCFLKDTGKGYSLGQRLTILHGIGSCLEYLHSIPVLHGDLTSCNILIDEHYNPRLTDFGLSSALEKLQTGMTYLNRRSTSPGALRWAAPELFDDECEPKPSADVYSFGCIMFEVLCGRIPWDDKRDMVVIRLKIAEGKFPERPTYPELQDQLWEVLVKCWSIARERPSAQQVVRYLTDVQSMGLRRHHRDVQVAAGSAFDQSSTGRVDAAPIATPYVNGIDRETAVHCGSGRFGDVYRCKCLGASSSSPFVAVKVIRYFSSPEDNLDAINRGLRRELGIWGSLDNSRGDIVPLLGVAKGFGPLDAVVSAWMPNGTLHSFLKDTGREYSLSQRLSILHGIGSCLKYLHSIPILHGNITSNNILIDEKYNPRLTDIGLSSAYFLRRSINPGALRWAAPELLDDEYKPKPSVDVYSFGCIMLEVLSGKIPWDGKPESVVIRLKIAQRKLPDRPTFPELHDELWELIMKCWSVPQERPNAQQAVRSIEDFQSMEFGGHSWVPEKTFNYGTSYHSAGNKRALLIAIRNVLSNHEFPGIPYAHRDARDLYRYLIGYDPSDIVLMIDSKSHPRKLWPTRTRILQQIDRLVKNAPDNCQIVFYYSGRVLANFECDTRHRRAIIAADGKDLTGDILHEHLITPLEKENGYRLFALFDSSYCDTILDLQLGEGPNTYSRRWSISRGGLFKAIAISIVHLLRLSKKHCHHVVPSPVARSHQAYSLNTLKSVHLQDKEKESHTRRLGVISLSASRDREEAHDDQERQLSFTKMFLDTLAARPELLWVELLDELRNRVSEMRAQHEEYLLRVLDKFNIVAEHWTQEPRYHTSRHMDLTRKVTF